MKMFKIEIEEILQKVINIEANSLEEAILNVEKYYNKGELILDANDLKEVNVREYK